VLNNALYNCDRAGLALSGTVTVTNNALFSNGAANTFSSSVTSSFNAFSGAWGGTCTNCVSGLANADFINATSGIYFPSASSKLKDAGTPVGVFTNDYLGTLRPQGPAWDIGPYEFLFDTAAPTVAVSAPDNLKTIGATVTVSATADDDVGIARVQFQLDGVPLGAAARKSPYIVAWDTTQVGDGPHTLTATAQDVGGNVTTSLPIVVIIDNATHYLIPSRGAGVFELRGASNTQVKVSHAYIVGGGNPATGIGLIRYETAGGVPAKPDSDAPSGIVVSEAGVPSTVATLTGMTYVDITGSLSTGVAIANETSFDAVINYYFTDADGITVNPGSLTLAAHHQIAGFLNSPPFGIPQPFRGTFTFSSSVPVAAIATRNLINERCEYVWSTMPISTAIPTGPRLLPLFADGGGWNTQVILTNGSTDTITGTVEFFGQGTSAANATPLAMTVNGISDSNFRYSIPPHSMYRIVGPGSSPINGSVRVTPDTGNLLLNIAPNAFAILSNKSNNVTVNETSV
ncbi:MAG: Ig-like domain-containing protein, partial [Nitrospirales bacterium]